MPFFHVLVRELSDEENDDGEFVVVPDEMLDVDQLVTEDILLDLPSKFLCSPNCKGLCPRCGMELYPGDLDWVLGGRRLCGPSASHAAEEAERLAAGRKGAVE